MKILKGSPSPLGLTITQNKANFAVFSGSATSVFLGLFKNGKLNKEIPLNRTENIWHVEVEDFEEGLTYAFRAVGPYDPKKGQLFKKEAWLSDPYGKSSQVKAIGPFDWQGVASPNIPKDNLIIYEMHVRGFTQHPTSRVSKPGTFLGIIEKIPYLKELGVNCIELLPIFGFDETYCFNVNPKTGKRLTNYWGYNTLHFFAPYSKYGVSDPTNEFKTLVRELHRNGIEILLDVVFSHTGEEGNINYYVNFRGLDNSVYYLINPDGSYQDYTGCKNTLNCNHPVVQELILSSLRYWIEGMHVDGFRFDLASIFNRDTTGKIIADSPLLQRIASDTVINKVKLIAEPWDAVGNKQGDSFPKWGPWSVWNGDFQDNVRNYIKGTDGSQSPFAEVFTGSQKKFRSPDQCVNYVTTHDGFSLRDLVSYNQKHNEENGERNNDGTDHNLSWNCGVEGPTDDPKINHLREKQMRNFLLALFLSQGIPLIKMGDEYGHTQKGNNNPYVQDNEISYFNWDQNKKIFAFFSALIAFRKARNSIFMKEKEYLWHGTLPLKADWNNRFIAVALKGKENLYLAFNPSSYKFSVTLPPGKWLEVVNTEKDWEEHYLSKDGPMLAQTFEIAPFSAILAKSVKN
ncbi:MAG TPA: isoamylase [Chlamydiales bacterium]|nr:isoamylase [Chlamydiales bacterium]